MKAILAGLTDRLERYRQNRLMVPAPQAPAAGPMQLVDHVWRQLRAGDISEIDAVATVLHLADRAGLGLTPADARALLVAWWPPSTPAFGRGGVIR